MLLRNKFLLFIAASLLIIQFFRPEKNVSDNKQPNHISSLYDVPDNVSVVLKSACTDCHSNNSKYPWYFNVQPVAWWLADHINDGKKHFNLDEFATYTLKKQDHKLEELIESQDDHWMPLESYTYLHKEAKLTEEQRNLLKNWAKSVRSKIQSDPDFQLTFNK